MQYMFFYRCEDMREVGEGAPPRAVWRGGCVNRA